MYYFCLYSFKMKIEVYNLLDLTNVAKQLIEFAATEKIFVFEGDMGAGKTTFIKKLCEALGVSDVVSSPTYSIVNEYESPNGQVFHFDFYRIKDIQEAYDLGYEEYFYGGAFCLIEWPERVKELLPDHYIKVEIAVGDDNQRIFSFSKA
ncbi:tRNA (adenosine(37)-N6)-threonylcarbamoyltransferase complex ATPase subunit type 1 TsaE [Pedobacter yonginense]|uniref:tRNA threonylcarbamoyladenosine biosynthesis protein TsaE n=2 Tax=Pedobacter yonginense TaxID=651869 RepID=A0A317EN72_9SPHI|nr:tRNA (adenosine(37)-N6)-threonylcarbamoyltransferase complex ATPase subunit type 1 TsaE [Pedobacter yonginense]